MAHVAVPVALAAASGAAGIQGAKAEARGLGAQATQTRMQARSEALKYKQQGVAVLDNMLRTMATQRAAAGAGSVDAFTGSAGFMRTMAQKGGAGEYYTTREGQTIVTRQGELQAIEYERQARAVVSAARNQAILGMVQAGAMGAMMGGAPTPTGGGPTINASTQFGLRAPATYQPLAFSSTYSPLTQTGPQQFMSLLGG
jgi:hypothetical protein